MCHVVCVVYLSRIQLVFCFRQKTAYELRISDWSSDVCSSDLLPAALLLSAAVHAGDTPPPRIVAVDGEGEVSTQPDRARLNLAADALDPELKTAESQVNGIVRAYLAEARALGATDKEISTAGISINPEYVWDDKAKKQKLVGYRARRDIAVTVSNLDTLGDLEIGRASGRERVCQYVLS